MSTTKVSVIVPAYNCADYIDEALGSLVSQSFDAWEAVIVDDGSTDATAEICDRWCRGDGRIRLITQSNSGGPSVPRNNAIAASHAEFVAFLDPDDYWMSEKLSCQLAIMDRYQQLSLLFDDSSLIDAEGLNIGSYFQSLDFLEKCRTHVVERERGLYLAKPSFLFFCSCVFTGIQTSGVMIRRSALRNLEYTFPVDLRNCEDNDLWWRLMQTSQVAFVDAALHAYRQHSAGLTSDQASVTQDRLKAHVRNYERVQFMMSQEWARCYRHRIAELHSILAWQAREKGDLASARSAYRNSLIWRRSFTTLVDISKTYIPKRAYAIFRRS